MHPLLRLVVDEPQVLAEHLAAYASLLVEEGGQAIERSQRRFGQQALGGIAIVVGATLCGVALMLWGALPSDAMPQPWLLLAVPALPLVVAAGLLAPRRGGNEPIAFERVRRQAIADAELWRSLRRPDPPTAPPEGAPW
jgi:hypothetical protein